MAKHETGESCPCGSEERYDNCCGRFHRGESYPSTALELMRSRYSAFVKQDIEYLTATWAKDQCPKPLTLEPTNWIGLKILSSKKGAETDTEGWVEFVAKYKVNGKAVKMQELSHFIREDGKWVYASAS